MKRLTRFIGAGGLPWSTKKKNASGSKRDDRESPADDTPKIADIGFTEIASGGANPLIESASVNELE